MANTVKETKQLECLGLASEAHSVAVRIYNIIREVGYDKLTADNALHQLVEDYANLHRLGDKISKLAEWIDTLSDNPVGK